MEPNEEKKKLNEDLVEFMRKRSNTEAPRYTARLKNFVDVQQRRRRAAAARRHSEHHYERKQSTSVARKKVEAENKDKNVENSEPISEDGRLSRGKRGAVEKVHERSISRSGHSDEGPSDRCGRRRRRRCGKRRRRSCRRRRRRRTSCRRRRRRSCRRRRRRRRSCSRRRRRRSCKRRRKRCR